MLKYFILIFSALIIAGPSFALSTDKLQPAVIEADSATLNQKTGICTYKGHVKLTQGSTVIAADTLITHLDRSSQLEQANALGQLASYTSMPDNSTLPFVAMAQTINYYPKKGLAVLIGQAKATQGSDSFAGPLINYDIKKQIVTTPSSTQGRTTIIIQPGQKISLPK